MSKKETRVVQEYVSLYKREQQILDVIPKCRTVKEVAERLTLREGKLRAYASKLEIDILKEIRKYRISRALKDGVATWEEFCATTGYTERIIPKFLREEMGIEIYFGKKKRSPAERADINSAISPKLSLAEISSKVREISGEEITRAGVLDYMIRTRKHKNWSMERKQVIEHARACKFEQKYKEKSFPKFLERRYPKGRERGDWAIEKALYHCFLSEHRRGFRLSHLDDYITTLSRWKQAVEDNEKPSLAELRKDTGLKWDNEVWKLLKSAGGYAFHKKGDRWAIRMDKKAKRKKIYSLMRGLLFKRAGEQDWATRNTIYYCFSSTNFQRHRLNNFDGYKKFLSNYEDAIKENKKLGVNQLRNGTAVNSETAGRILLERLGLPLLNKYRLSDNRLCK